MLKRNGVGLGKDQFFHARIAPSVDKKNTRNENYERTGMVIACVASVPVRSERNFTFRAA